jgi:hypothetical protein
LTKFLDLARSSAMVAKFLLTFLVELVPWSKLYSGGSDIQAILCPRAELSFRCIGVKKKLVKMVGGPWPSLAPRELRP